MQATTWSWGAAAVGVVAMISGCGGGSTAASGDSGTGGDGACVPDADLTSLSVPDAAIGDAGVTLADCYGCVVSHCQDQLAACDVDCACNSAVASMLPCMAAGTKLGECAEALTGELALAVFGCIEPNCAFICSGQPDGG
jgi:hypothetical protein